MSCYALKGEREIKGTVLFTNCISSNPVQMYSTGFDESTSNVSRKFACEWRGSGNYYFSLVHV